MKIAAAQTIPAKGDVAENLIRHKKFINAASEHGVNVIVFPELSLTGYEPSLAKELAFSCDDTRLLSLRELAIQNNMIIIAGAPLQEDNLLYIAAFIFHPDGSHSIYTKHYLHPGEEMVFTPGNLNPQLKIENDVVSLAICADIANPVHAEDAWKSGATLYLTGALISKGGYKADCDLLEKYARQYKMTVLLSNFGGDSGGYEVAGQSAVWSDRGEVLAKMQGTDEGFAVITKEEDDWTGKVVVF